MRFVFLFIVTALRVDAIEIRCTFLPYDWNHRGGHYSCLADVEVTEPNVRLTSTAGMHTQSKSNSDVLGFIVVKKTAHFILKGVEDVFPNFNELIYMNTDMRNVTKSDFGGYTKLQTLAINNNKKQLNFAHDALESLINLQYLSLSDNNLKSLPNVKTLTELRELHFSGNSLESLSAVDLESNSQLRIVAFVDNKLKHIPLNVFGNLNSLEAVDLRNNTCINFNLRKDLPLRRLQQELVDLCA